MVKSNNIKPNSILTEAEYHVEFLLTVMLPEGMSFHNLQHTRQVVAAAKEISAHLEISEKEKEIIQLAAWFHDTGYIMAYHGHENYSQQIAFKFLQNYNWSQIDIVKVLKCIDATIMSETPSCQLGAILCDADLYHLTLPSYPRLLNQLREEWAIVLGQAYPDTVWRRENLKFLYQHQFCTKYGQEVLEPKKQKVIENYLKSV